MGVVELAAHPSELRAVIERYVFYQAAHPRDPASEDAGLRRCYRFLRLTSRSFAAVIEELHPRLRDAVMLFYLCLRGLDTIEDDMSIPLNVKENLLCDFYRFLDQDGWTFTDCGPNEKDRQLLVEFDVVIDEFRKLDPVMQDIIRDITREMGHGMADFARRDGGIETVQDLDLYCHYVAGIVGEGLSRLFVACQMEDESYLEATGLSNSMGLFLQKTNIIRDFREDLDDKRSFWPREIWSKYVHDPKDFLDDPQLGQNCISDLTVNTLQHATDCLVYLSGLKEQTVFNFCAIPQVMAIATLALVFRNKDVFQRNIKIRRGLAVKLISEATNLHNVSNVFRKFVREIHAKNDPRDPNFLRVSVECGKVWTSNTTWLQLSGLD